MSVVRASRFTLFLFRFHMSIPPPPAPPPPPTFTRSAAVPIRSLTSLLAANAHTSGDLGSTSAVHATGNPAGNVLSVSVFCSFSSLPVHRTSSLILADAAKPAKYEPPPKKETNSFLAELQCSMASFVLPLSRFVARLGTPTQATQSSSSPNPSLSRPGYRAPADLPQVSFLTVAVD